MGKKELAKKTWKQGLEIKSDLMIYSELLKCISGESHPQMTSKTFIELGFKILNFSLLCLNLNRIFDITTI